MKNQYLSVATSKTLGLNNLSKFLEKKGRTIYKFGFGQSPFDPPINVIRSLQDNALRTDYTGVQGDLLLRQHIARFHKKANGLITNPEDILVAPGSKILLYTILLSHQDADVLVAAPSWVTYRPQTKLCNHHLINIPTTFENRWRITPETLESALSKKKKSDTILIINYPGNPDGLSYSKSEIEALTVVARKYKVLVISDEIYALLQFEKNHYSFANAYPERTITTTGLSKWCGAGGWRLGVALLSENLSAKFKQSICGIGSEVYSCATSPVQSAATEAYRSFDQMQIYLAKQIEILKAIGTYCFEMLRKNDIKLYPTEGGFYLFPDFSNYQSQLKAKGIQTSEALCHQLLNELGIAMLPGTAFGMEPAKLVTRLAFVDFKDPLHKLNDIDLRKICPKIITGMEKLEHWIQQL